MNQDSYPDRFVPMIKSWRWCLSMSAALGRISRIYRGPASLTQFGKTLLMKFCLLSLLGPSSNNHYGKLKVSNMAEVGASLSRDDAVPKSSRRWYVLSSKIVGKSLLKWLTFVEEISQPLSDRIWTFYGPRCRSWRTNNRETCEYEDFVGLNQSKATARSPADRSFRVMYGRWRSYEALGLTWIYLKRSWRFRMWDLEKPCSLRIQGHTCYRYG